MDDITDLEKLTASRNQKVTIAADLFLETFRREYQLINDGLKDRRTAEQKRVAREAYAKIAEAARELHRTSRITKLARLIPS